MVQYPIYYHNKYYMYDTTSDTYSEPYLTPEDLATETVIVSPPIEFVPCLDVSRRLERTKNNKDFLLSDKFTTGPYLTSEGCKYDDVELSPREYERFLRNWFYQEALLARSDNPAELQNKVSRLPEQTTYEL